MKRSERLKIDKFKEFLIFIIVILILLTILGFSRRSDYVVYEPFSRKLFYINPEEVDKIILGNGPENVGFTSAEEKRMAADIINNIRYYFLIPKLPIGMGGWTYRFQLVKGENIKSYYFGGSSIEINGFNYYCDLSELNKLMESYDL